MDSPLKRLQMLAAQWNVRYHRIAETATSLIAFGVLSHRPVVLKVVRQKGDEWDAGAVAAAFGGNGVVPVIAHEPGAVLMHELQPAGQLTAVVLDGDDEKACSIIGDVIRRMPEIQADQTLAASAEQWGEAFERYLSTGDKRLNRDLVRMAGDSYALLCSTQKRRRLLHGDLQHYNILFDEQLGWTAIDPKGVIAELEFEFGAALRNPHGVPAFYSSLREIERRIRALAAGIAVDVSRISRWAYVQAVLSVIWSLEDEGNVRSDDPALSLAQNLHA